MRSFRHRVMALICGVATAALGSAGLAQDGAKQTTEPVYRVGHNNGDATTPTTKPDLKVAESAHPLDKALEIAANGLDHIQRNINDYTAILVKRERINGRLLDPEYMAIKVRNRKNDTSRQVPFSIYLKFLKPKEKAEREAIWVEGQNENKLVAHDNGWKNIVTAKLDPVGAMAMKDNRYPIYDLGIENLVAKLLERGGKEKQYGCEVEFFENTKINGRQCTMIQVKHPEPHPGLEFYIARIFVDDELNIPIRYAAYIWPTEPGGQPQVLEEYTYLNVQLNVGLTDLDFDPKNPAYIYP